MPHPATCRGSSPAACTGDARSGRATDGYTLIKSRSTRRTPRWWHHRIARDPPGKQRLKHAKATGNQEMPEFWSDKTVRSFAKATKSETTQRKIRILHDPAWSCKGIFVLSKNMQKHGANNWMHDCMTLIYPDHRLFGKSVELWVDEWWVRIPGWEIIPTSCFASSRGDVVSKHGMFLPKKQRQKKHDCFETSSLHSFLRSMGHILQIYAPQKSKINK